MGDSFDPIRYSVIEKKNPREIVMLRGSGCKWRKCRFCDYHLDFSKDEKSNYDLNKEVLSHVTGLYHRLEVINSGSFIDLDKETIHLIKEICLTKQIHILHFECHWIHRNEIKAIREEFKKANIQTIVKSGIETFDYNFRENIFRKGIDEKSPEVIANYFDEVCLLQGVEGQTLESMKKDIKIGLSYFNRVCVNIMVENGMPVKPDKQLIEDFVKEIYPIYKNNDRVDILLENTDFGVGGSNE